MKSSNQTSLVDETFTRVRKKQKEGPCAIVIFGGVGDLSTRKLLPALFELFCTESVMRECVIVGVGLPELNHDAFRDLVSQSLKKRNEDRELVESMLVAFLRRTFYLTGDFANPGLYADLDVMLNDMTKRGLTTDNRLYYFSVPPSVFSMISKNLQAHGMTRVKGPHHWRRVIIEKPFGRDLESARKLNRDLEQAFEEWQIYRIDHYLAKEPVQNIMAFRFANGIFEPLWNNKHIDHVQITAAESVGIEKRGKYFEESGALRDMVQNHLMQLLALVAMEPPPTFDANAVRDEHAKVFRSIRPIPADLVDEYVVRGQYGPGVVNKKKVSDYRNEPDVSSGSIVETYVAAKLFIDNWRWAGVPFYIRTGKRLPKQLTEIAIYFRQSPHILFNRMKPSYIASNALVLRIQKEESIALHFDAKIPGHEMELQHVKMNFHYHEAFGVKTDHPYARLIFDCMKGDATLFMRKDNVELGWWLMMPILDYWANAKPSDFPNYPAGSIGPENASLLIWKDGKKWRGF
jgi:glucose-6-phosphate 1-dehydrogenase